MVNEDSGNKGKRNKDLKETEVRGLLHLTFSEDLLFPSPYLLCARVRVGKGKLREKNAWFFSWPEAGLAPEQSQGSGLVGAAGSTNRGAPRWLGAGSSSPTLLDASAAPLFPAEEFAACTTGTMSGIKCASGWRRMFQRAELSLLLAWELEREEGVPGLCWCHGLTVSAGLEGPWWGWLIFLSQMCLRSR